MWVKRNRRYFRSHNILYRLILKKIFVVIFSSLSSHTPDGGKHLFISTPPNSQPFTV